MDIYFSPYKLNPLKRSNRLSSMDPKPGIHLKAKVGNQTVYADYFPHIFLGDRSCEQFLAEFKDQKDEYDRKVLDLLLNDHAFQKQTAISFKNHQLWTGSELIDSPIIKYKMTGPHDTTPIDILKKKIKLRLDVNALFNRNSYNEFFQSLPDDFKKLIEYIEDPLSENDWTNLPLPAAQDFISSNYRDYYIYKPNCEFYPDVRAKVIFSAYLGSDLGKWHTYCELVNKADLSLTHGIIAEGFYKEERNFYQGNYHNGFTPNLNQIRDIYQELALKSWKLLCSI